MSEDLEIIYRDPAVLVPYEKNARTHSAEQVRQIRRSIEEFGFANPILLRDDEQSIGAGHGRQLAALLRPPLKRVPTIVLKGLSDVQWRALIVADNKLAMNAGWDEGLLRLELGELAGEGFDLSIMGFSSLELNGLFATVEGETDPDDVPEPPKIPVSRSGDLWLFEGGHRVICGDCTSKEVVSRLLEGRAPVLCSTDSPYGVSYDPAWRSREVPQVGKFKAPNRSHGAVQNDTRADWREAWALFPGDVIYVWHDGANPAPTQLALEACGFEIRSQIIWRKTSMVVGRGHYHWAHETCQPAGTMVKRVLKDGRWKQHSEIEEVPIESLRDGDKVASYNPYESVIRRRGRKIRTSKRHYDGNMFSIKCAGKTTRATDGHLFSARFDATASGLQVIYLMRRGNWWRIGQVRVFNSRGFGMADELADEAWIIAVTPNPSEAKVLEQALSCRYGIPTTHWNVERSARTEGLRSAEQVAKIYSIIGLDRIQTGALELLAAYGRSPIYPLLEKGEKGIFSRVCTRLVRACNIIPGLMQLPVPTSGEDFNWEPISGATFAPFSGEVYSMDVEKDAHYIADGLVTHNCFYAVRKTGNGHWTGGRKQTTVWDIDAPKRSETGHGTQKPVECMARPITSNSALGDLIYDPFLGSGSTLIGVHMNKRVLAGCEIDPVYVDVIVQRFANFTGLQPTLAETGETFEQVREARLEVV